MNKLPLFFATLAENIFEDAPRYEIDAWLALTLAVAQIAIIVAGTILALSALANTSREEQSSPEHLSLERQKISDQAESSRE